MAANPLAVNLAAADGIAISWGTWALAGLVPGLICLLTVPLILYALYPPGACCHMLLKLSVNIGLDLLCWHYFTG